MHVGVLGLTSHLIVIVLNRCVIDQTRDGDVFLCTSRMRIDPHLTRWTRLAGRSMVGPRGGCGRSLVPLPLLLSPLSRRSTPGGRDGRPAPGIAPDSNWPRLSNWWPKGAFAPSLPVCVSSKKLTRCCAALSAWNWQAERVPCCPSAEPAAFTATPAAHRAPRGQRHRGGVARSAGVPGAGQSST